MHRAKTAKEQEMAQEEQYASRCRAYSAWHRTASIERYLEPAAAKLLAMCDVDMLQWVEYDATNKQPLALIECARDVAQSSKPAPVLAALAIRSRLPAYTVLYRLAASNNPADPTAPDIDQFRVRRIWPTPETAWRILKPEQWARALLQIRSWSAARILGEAANDPQYRLPPAAAGALRK
jgi:hypothetical protein